MIHIVAVMHAQPGRREAFLKAWAKVAPLSRAEPGCLEYLALVDGPPGSIPSWANSLGPDGFILVEKFKDQAAFDAHGASPYMAVFGAETEGMLTAPAIYICRPQ
jgi:quinol monooxygenase YgiN